MFLKIREIIASILWLIQYGYCLLSKKINPEILKMNKPLPITRTWIFSKIPIDIYMVIMRPEYLPHLSLERLLSNYHKILEHKPSMIKEFPSSFWNKDTCRIMIMKYHFSPKYIPQKFIDENPEYCQKLCMDIISYLRENEAVADRQSNLNFKKCMWCNRHNIYDIYAHDTELCFMNSSNKIKKILRLYDTEDVVDKVLELYPLEIIKLPVERTNYNMWYAYVRNKNINSQTLPIAPPYFKVPEQFMNDKICKTIVKKSGDLSELPKHMRTIELCEIALVEKHKLAQLEYIPLEFQTFDLIVSALKKYNEYYHEFMRGIEKYPFIHYIGLLKTSDIWNNYKKYVINNDLREEIQQIIDDESIFRDSITKSAII